jgi:hypothetical protein
MDQVPDSSNWREFGLCRGHTDLFYSATTHKKRMLVRELCVACPVFKFCDMPFHNKASRFRLGSMVTHNPVFDGIKGKSEVLCHVVPSLAHVVDDELTDVLQYAEEPNFKGALKELEEDESFNDSFNGLKRGFIYGD